MKRWVSLSAVSLAGAVAAATVADLVWNLQTARRVAKLHQPDTKSRPFSRDDLAGLPAPAVRYFEFALTLGQPLVRAARVQQIGEFAMRPDSWSPFTAVEHFAVEPPGFVWDARIRMAGIMPFYVRDAYIAGQGALYGTLAALIPVVNERGTPTMATAELLRYLAEAVWLPTALLPRNGIAWTPLDDNSARVTLTDGPTLASCDVNFSERGDIVRISAMRSRDADGTSVLTPWVGHWSDYRRVEGMMIPMSGGVEWVLPAGPAPYWRGRIVDARYEFASSR